MSHHQLSHMLIQAARTIELVIIIHMQSSLNSVPYSQVIMKIGKTSYNYKRHQRSIPSSRIHKNYKISNAKGALQIRRKAYKLI